jgi:RloB-like protein
MPTKGRRAEARTRRPRPGFPRETDLRRRIDIRDEGRSILIVTNGERTEVDYFNGIKEEPWITATKVIVKFQRGEPAAVVLRSAVMRDENDYDEAWVVCDVDQYDVTLAIADAKARQVELTLSVPCFEVWLILHLSESCPGFNDCPQADRHLKGLLPSWDKTSLRFSDFRAGVFHAVARAKRLGDPPDANPSTAVWRVIESLSAEPEVAAEQGREGTRA